jgi:hypothetical protein
MSDKQTKKKPGCFRVSAKAMSVLLGNNPSPWVIGAYLTLARYTDESGRFSTAGFQSIQKSMRITPGTEKKPGPGRQAVNSLLEYARWGETKSPRKKVTPEGLDGMLYTSEEYLQRTGLDVPKTTPKYPVRWFLNDYGGEEWVWLPNTLVDGIGKFRQPLRRLKQCGVVAARLLLLLYKFNNPEEFGGVPPYLNTYVNYQVTHVKSSHNATCWWAEKKDSFVFDKISLPALCLPRYSNNETEKDKQIKLFWEARKALEHNGFIYQMVTVMDGAPDKEDSRPMYELHSKAMHSGGPARGEEGLAKRIDQLAVKGFDLGSTADSQGRFRDDFYALSRGGIIPHVVGIFRLRFRISNPKNHTVKEAWTRIAQDQQETLEFIDHLERSLGMAEQPPTPGSEEPSPPLQNGLHQSENEVNADYLPF